MCMQQSFDFNLFTDPNLTFYLTEIFTIQLKCSKTYIMYLKIILFQDILFLFLFFSGYYFYKIFVNYMINLDRSVCTLSIS